MKHIAIIITLLSLFACSSGNYYKKHSSGFEYRVLKKSEKKDSITEGDIIELKLKYFTDKDSLLFNSAELTSSFKMQVKPSSHKGGSFEDAIKIMNIGDRYKFKINADSFYTKTQAVQLPRNIKPSSYLIFDVEILRKLSKDEINRERELQHKQLKRQEQLMLRQYIEENAVGVKPTQSGLYYIEKKRGRGKRAVNGDSLLVHYTGKLINGQIFDSSYDRNEIFLFTLGDSKIIKAWNEGFSFMREGGEATFIIPSELAYGDRGYSTIIPPFASLIFEVKLVEIKKTISN